MPAPIPDPLRAARTAALAAYAGLLAVGCSTSTGPGSPDPERQSASEYDVARDLFQRRGEPRQGLEHALEAVELDSDNADAAHLVGLIYLAFCMKGPEDCHLADAERYVRQAIGAKKDFREAKNTLGVILVHEKHYDEAIAVLEPLTKDILYTTPEIAWGNLGWAWLEKGDADKAIDALKRAVAAEPRFCVGYYRIGQAYEKKNDYAAALGAYDSALGSNDKECQGLQDAWAARCKVLVRAGRTADARSDCERCVKLSATTATGKECNAALKKFE